MAEPLDSMPGKLDALAARVEHLEAAVAENTELTRDIKDALGGLRVFGNVMKWIAGVVAGGVAVVTAWSHFGGGKP